MVEHNLAKVGVASSNLVSRSIFKGSKTFCFWAFFICDNNREFVFYTYIIYSQSRDRYYTGYSSATLQDRLYRHNNGMTFSTKSGIPWKFVFIKSFGNKTDAIKFENLIKRKKAENLLKGWFSLIKMKYLNSSVAEHPDCCRDQGWGCPETFGISRSSRSLLIHFKWLFLYSLRKPILVIQWEFVFSYWDFY